jgi:hypothetical protein
LVSVLSNVTVLFPDATVLEMVFHSPFGLGKVGIASITDVVYTKTSPLVVEEAVPIPNEVHLSEGPVKTKVTLEDALFKLNLAVISLLNEITGVDFDCENPQVATSINKRVIFFIKFMIIWSN